MRFFDKFAISLRVVVAVLSAYCDKFVLKDLFLIILS